MNCRVEVESAIQVYDVETPDEAVQIAISKVGEMLNPDLNYVEIDTRDRVEQDPAYVVADQALVGLVLEMTVFNVEQKEHASRVARKEIGERLSSIPLEVVDIEVIEEDNVEEDNTEENDADGEDNTDGEDDETLPEFDEIADNE
jgi:uncharacterized protein (UPF0212 family)